MFVSFCLWPLKTTAIFVITVFLKIFNISFPFHMLYLYNRNDNTKSIYCQHFSNLITETKFIYIFLKNHLKILDFITERHETIKCRIYLIMGVYSVGYLF